MLCAAVPSPFLATPTYKSGRMCRTESGGAQQPQCVEGDRTRMQELLTEIEQRTVIAVGPGMDVANDADATGSDGWVAPLGAGRSGWSAVASLLRRGVSADLLGVSQDRRTQSTRGCCHQDPGTMQCGCRRVPSTRHVGPGSWPRTV